MEQSTDLKWQRDDFTDITEPFENDLLNRKPLAEHLTRYIDRLQVGAVLALDARWGEGKTWFVMHWQKYLEQTAIPHKVIYINAFAQDHIDDPFLLIAAELRAIIAQDLSAQKRFTEKVMQVSKVLAPAAYKAAISTGVKWVMDINDGGDKLEKLQEKLIDAASEQVGLWVEKQIKEHENNKNAFANFKTVLKELAAKHEQPIVIIIDELDRCNPLFSVRLIERIKHFFDIPNIVFVLVCDKHQLQKTICHQFGYDENLGEAYLDKFIDFSIKFEKNRIKENEYLNAIEKTMHQLGFDENIINDMKFDIQVYSTVFNISIRQLYKILNQFSLIGFNNDINRDRFLIFKLIAPSYIDNLEIYSCMCHAFYFYPNKIKPTHYVEKVSEFKRSFASHIVGDIQDADTNFDFDSFKINSFQAATHRIVFTLLEEKVGLEDFIDKNTHHSPPLYRGDTQLAEISNAENQFTKKISSYCPSPISNYKQMNSSWNEYIKTGLNE